MIIQVGMPPQQYCLRWNNHKNNMLTVFDELLREESFTDVTFVCEDGLSMRSHKMVLAACSSYFKALFEEILDSNPVLILKDVRFWEMRTILEYMYRGEVSVEQSQLSSLLKTAEAFKVKGLIDESNSTYKSKFSDHDEMNTISTSSPVGFHGSLETGHNRHHHHHRHSRNNSPNENNVHRNKRDGAESYERSISNELLSNDNTNASSNGNTPANHSNNIENCSPPHSTGIHQSFPKSMYHYNKPSERPANRISIPGWPLAPPSVPLGMFNSYESVIAGSHDSEIPPLRRKKLSSFSMNKDTPILRTVLGQGQGQADSSQPMSLVCHSADNQDHTQSNGPTASQDMTFIKNMKSESMSEDVHSPHMDTSFMEEDMNHQERINKMMHSSSPSPQSFYSESKVGGVSSAIATYVPTQKPEWKRYKQYTRNDIMSAIESVKNGMSALQAAKKYGVPSRTLYDKVKKLGISTQRPFRRSSSNSGAHFPYGLSGTSASMIFSMGGDEESSAQTMLEHGFLQHALEGKIKLDTADREAMSSSGSHIPPHGLLQQALELGERYKAEITERGALSGVGPGNASGTSSSPGPGDRSPSPNFVKYSQRGSISPVPPNDDDDNDDYEDEVEDLSISRKPEPQQPLQPQQQQQSRVIMPPMSQATASALLNSCTVDNSRD